MLSKFFKREETSQIPERLYDSIVGQSRRSEFFTDFGFKDTVTGRFDVLALHLFLFSRRLVRESSPLTDSLNQEVFDWFVDETDRALRELGVGDTTVPKRKKKLVRGFYALVEMFSSPLDARDRDLLEARISQRFDSDDARHVETALLADYLMKASTYLDDQPVRQILRGELTWPSAKP